MPQLTPDQERKVREEVTKYAQSGATEAELHEFGSRLIAGLEEDNKKKELAATPTLNTPVGSTPNSSVANRHYEDASGKTSDLISGNLATASPSGAPAPAPAPAPRPAPAPVKQGLSSDDLDAAVTSATERKRIRDEQLNRHQMPTMLQDTHVVTSDGVKINLLAPTAMSQKDLHLLQGRIQNKNPLPQDIDLIANNGMIADGKKKVSKLAAETYIKDGRDAGITQDATDEVADRSSRVSDAVKNLTQYYHDSDAETLSSNPEAMSKLIEHFDTLQAPERKALAYDDIGRPVAYEKDADYEARPEVQQYRAAIGEYGKVRNDLRKYNQKYAADLLAEGKITKDEAINLNLKYSDPVNFRLSNANRVEYGLGVRNAASILGGAISDITGHTATVAGQLQIPKGIAEGQLNEALTERAALLANEARKTGDPTLLAKAAETQKHIDPHYMARYPSLIEANLTAGITDYIATVSGAKKGSDKDPNAPQSLVIFGDQGSKLKYAEKYLRDNGYLSNPQTKEVAKKILQDIDDSVDKVGESSYAGGMGKSFADVFIGMGKGIADVTGFRNDSDVAAERIRENYFPDQAPDLKTSVKIAQNVLNTSSQVLGQAALQYITAGAGKFAGLSEAAAKNAAFWTTGSLTQYDSSLKDAQEFSDSKLARHAFATINSLAAAYSERFFEDIKFFKSLEVTNTIKDIAQRLGSENFTREGADQLLMTLKDKLIKAGKSYGTNVHSEALEEASTAVVNDVSRMLFGDKSMDFEKMKNDVFDTYAQTVVGTSLIGTWGAHADMKQEKNSSFKSDLYAAAVKHDATQDALTRGFRDGTMSQAQMNSGMQVLNTAKSALGEMHRLEATTNLELDNRQRQVFVANRTAEAVLENEIANTTDEVTKQELQDRVDRLREQRQQIIKNNTKFDETLRPATTPDQQSGASDTSSSEIGTTTTQDAQTTQTVPTTGVGVETTQAIPEEEQAKIDERIAANQQRLSLPTAPEIRLSDDAKSVTKKIDAGEDVSPDEMKTLSDELYGRYKVLNEAKNNSTRSLTREQYQAAIDSLAGKIDMLESTRSQTEDGKAAKIDKDAFNNAKANEDTAHTNSVNKIESDNEQRTNFETFLNQDQQTSNDGGLQENATGQTEGDTTQVSSNNDQTGGATAAPATEGATVGQKNTFTRADAEGTSDGSGLQNEGNPVLQPEKIAANFSDGDKVTFFAEKERTGTWNNGAVVDENGNRWGLTGIISDPAAWIRNDSRVAAESATATTAEAAPEATTASPAASNEPVDTKTQEPAKPDNKQENRKLSDEEVIRSFTPAEKKRWRAALLESDEAAQEEVDKKRSKLEPKTESAKKPTKKAPKAAPAGVLATDSASLSQLEDDNADDATKVRVIRQVRKAVEAIRSALPNLDIRVHSNEDDYNESIKQFDGRAGTSANFGWLMDEDGNILSTQIDINLSRANVRSVAHEITHGVLLHSFGDNPYLFRRFRDNISSILAKSADKQLRAFSEDPRYAQSVQPEEYLAELTGLIGEKGKVPTTVLAKVAQAINDIVSYITDGKFIPFENIDEATNTLAYFQSLADNISRGASISDTINLMQRIEDGNQFEPAAMRMTTIQVPENIDETDRTPNINVRSRSRVDISEEDLIDPKDLAGKPILPIYYDNTRVGDIRLKNNKFPEVSSYTYGQGGSMFSFRKLMKEIGAVGAFTNVGKGLDILSYIKDATKRGGSPAISAITLQSKTEGHLGNIDTLLHLYGPEGQLQQLVKAGHADEAELVSLMKEGIEYYRKFKDKQQASAAKNAIKKGDKPKQLIKPIALDNVNTLKEIYEVLLAESFGNRGEFNKVVFNQKRQMNASTPPFRKTLYEKFGVPDLTDLANAMGEPVNEQAEAHDILKYVEIDPTRMGVTDPALFTPKNIAKAKSRGVTLELLDKKYEHRSYPVIFFGKNIGVPKYFHSVREYHETLNVDNPFMKAGRRGYKSPIIFAPNTFNNVGKAPNIKAQSKQQISQDHIEGTYVEPHMTETKDGKNYVFFHVSSSPESAIRKGINSTKQFSTRTSNEEKSTQYGVASYYTKQTDGERMVQGKRYEVHVPKSKVYSLDLDPNNYRAEAESKIAKGEPYRQAKINKYVAEKAKAAGYSMMVSEWNYDRGNVKDQNLALRADALVTLKPNQETGDYESNYEKGVRTSHPDASNIQQSRKMQRFAEKVSDYLSQKGRYDEAYDIAESLRIDGGIREGIGTGNETVRPITAEELHTMTSALPKSVLKGMPVMAQSRAQLPDVQDTQTNSQEEVNRIKSLTQDNEDGSTMNLDGTPYTEGGLIVPVISLNTTQQDLTPETIARFVNANRNKIGNGNFKVGVYKFPNSNKVSVDLNIVTNPEHRDVAVEFARAAGQESLFDLDTFQNVKTGADGMNPMNFTDEEFMEIGNALAEGRMPDVFPVAQSRSQNSSDDKSRRKRIQELFDKGLLDEAERDEMLADLEDRSNNESNPNGHSSSIKNKSVAEKRRELNVGGATNRTRRTDAEVRAEADAAIKAGFNIKELVDDILDNKDQPSDVEIELISRFVAGKEAQIRSLNEDIEKSARLGKDIKGLSDQRDTAVIELNDAYNAAREGGTETARALRYRKNMKQEDESLAAMFVNKSTATGLSRLSPDMIEEVTAQYNELKEIKDKYEKKIRNLEAQNRRIRADKNLGEVKKKVNRAAGKKKEDYQNERSNLVDAIRNKIKSLGITVQQQNASGSNTASRSQLSPDDDTTTPNTSFADALAQVSPEVEKLVRSFVEENKDITLQKLTDEIHAILDPVIPNITKGDVRDLIGGEYRTPKQTRTELMTKIVDLKRQAALQKRLEDLMAGRDRAKTKPQKTAWSREVQDLEKQINDFRQTVRDQEAEARRKSGQRAIPEAKALEMLKKRTESEIRRLQGRIDNNDFDPDPEVAPLKLDREAIDLRNQLVQKRKEIIIGLARDEMSKRTKTGKFIDLATEMLNLPRTIMASMDLSAPLRQAVIVSFSHPLLAMQAGVEMWKQARSQERYDRWLADLKESPIYTLMQQSKLYIADKDNPVLAAKEERFMSNLAERIPIVGKGFTVGGVKLGGLNLIGGSERAYTSYLNKMRTDMFVKAATEFQRQGKTFENSPELYKALGSYLNNATGRGSLGALEPAAQVLNNAFFSPRLIAARLNTLNPMFYAKMPSDVRKMALLDLAGFAGVGSMLIALTKLASMALHGGGGDDDDKGVTVEIDPRSSDFAKIKFKNSRWDVWGGFQQYIRFFSQMVTGRVKTGQGMIQKLDGSTFPFKNRFDGVVSFVRGKLAPVPAFGVNLLAGGKDPMGQEMTVGGTLQDYLLPMIYNDVSDAKKDLGWAAIPAVGIPALLGVGVANYEPKKKHEVVTAADKIFKQHGLLPMSVGNKNQADIKAYVGTDDPKHPDGKMTDQEFQRFGERKAEVLAQKIEEFKKKGVPIILPYKGLTKLPLDKLNAEQLKEMQKELSTKANEKVKQEMFGQKKEKPEKESDVQIDL